MELNYLLLLSFLFYLFLGIYLIVKNNNISSSSTYLGLFFIALGFSPLSLVLYNINYDDAFFLPYLVIQTHMFWFYYYINAVIGNKISKFNFYFSIILFALIFMLNIYSAIEITQSGIFSKQTKIFPFQVIKGEQLSFITRFNYLVRILLSVIIYIYALFILKKFKNAGLDKKSKKDLYRWLINMVIFLLIFSSSRIALFLMSMYLTIDFSSINFYYFIFTQLLLLFFVSQIFKYPLISLGIPISKRTYKPKINEIDQTSRMYLFDSNLMNQKLIDWENSSNSYLNKNFNLSKFAKEIEIDELEIIYYLNEYKEINFEDYLNFLRISFVLSKIEQHFLKEHSISELAEVAGFSDRKNLESIFKKILNRNLQEFIEHE
jgi:YesN/AraC family two-component response regulator